MDYKTTAPNRLRFEEFIESKSQLGGDYGFKPSFLPGFLFDFQRHLVDWSVRRGRAAIFAECGLGKSPVQLTWAQNIVEKTNMPVLILTPLAVSAQTVREASKFNIEAKQSRDGAINSKIVVTNYHKLHHFNPNDFAGVVCDESGILKNYDGAIKSQVTEFMKKTKYRLLCTATPAPNDLIELGTSSEALGELGFIDMLSRFFKKAESTTSRSDEFRAGVYRFRGHAEQNFWRWVCSWSRAIRKPSDLGFSDDKFKLPELTQTQHIVSSDTPPDGFLFFTKANSLQEQRAERRRTLKQRCEKAASLICDTGKPAVAWCHLNDEGNLLEKLIPGSVEVDGSDSDEFKEESFEAFSAGQIRVLVSKPTVAGFGLNWQHCAHQTFFPSHSFEQYYQAVRRSWRFGQRNPVHVDMVTSEGESVVLESLERKSKAADEMFENLVRLINNELRIISENKHVKKQELPSWL